MKLGHGQSDQQRDMQDMKDQLMKIDDILKPIVDKIEYKK